MDKKKFWSVNLDEEPPEYYFQAPLGSVEEDDGRPWLKFDEEVVALIIRQIYSDVIPEHLKDMRPVMRRHFLNVLEGKEKPIPILAKYLRLKEEIF